MVGDGLKRILPFFAPHIFRKSHDGASLNSSSENSVVGCFYSTPLICNIRTDKMTSNTRVNLTMNSVVLQIKSFMGVCVFCAVFSFMVFCLEVIDSQTDVNCADSIFNYSYWCPNNVVR